MEGEVMRGIKNPNVDIKTDGNNIVITDGKTEYFRKLKTKQTVAIANDIYFVEKYMEVQIMKIYVLLKQDYDGSDTICVSEDINKIRTSICEDFDPNEDYPELEVWNYGEMIYRSTGNDVLKMIASEMK